MDSGRAALGRHQDRVRRILMLMVILLTPSCGEKPESKSGLPGNLTTSAGVAIYVNEMERRLKAGECREVEPEIRARLEELASTMGTDSVLHADLLDLLVYALWECGKEGQPETMELAKRALALRIRLHGDDELALGSSLFNLGVICAERGDLAASKTYLLKNYEVRRKALGENHPDIIRPLHALGNIYSMSGDVVTALSYYEKSLTVTKRVFGESAVEASNTLDSISMIYAKMGLLDKGVEVCKRALEIRESAYGPDSKQVAHSCLNYAEILFRADPTRDVRPLIQRAIDICNKLGIPDNPLLTVCYNDMGCVSYARSDLDRAERNFQLAIEARERAYGRDHVSAASALMNLASLTADRGDYEKAETIYERALKTLRETLGTRHPMTMHCLRSLAMLSLFRGESAPAFQKGLLVEQLARDHATEMTESMNEMEAMAFQEHRTSGIDVALSAMLSLNGKGETRGLVSDAWNDLIHSRGLVLDEVIQRRRFLERSDVPGVDSLLTEYEAASNRLSRSRRLAEAGEDDAGVAEAIHEMEELERAIARKSSRHAAMRRELDRSRSTGLREVLASLPERSSLVAYVRYHAPLPVSRSDTWPPGTKMSQSLDFEGFGQTAQPGISLPSYLAFVCRPPDPPQARYLGEASLIDTLVSRWREAAFASPGDVEAQTAAGTALRKAIWDPVSPLLGEEDRVFVIPDGFLNQINLDALPDPGGGFLAETMPLFCYLPVERDVAPASAKEGPSRESNDTGGLLVLGGADYWYADAADTEPSTGSSVRGDAVLFAGLPGAEAEAKDIADLWASRAPDPHARVVVLTGREAGEAAFKRNVRGRKVIHLATHAFFNRPEQAWRSPLESSGLALAGANLLPVTGERKEDGILYADEVAVLDLSGVDWVVLSACETALGAIRAREGVLGLRRAFQVAGARTLIMSLWSVEDGATRKWMHTLYAGRLSGMSTAAALREANLDAIRSLRGGDKSRVSARWGAFVAVGHWR